MAKNPTTSLERSIGTKYASLLQASVRNAIQQESASFGRLALRTKVTSKMKDGKLQRLVLDSPKHSFINHYGFEGVRSNGRKLSLKSVNHLSGLRQVEVLNGLANEIGAIRAEEVIAQINF